MRPVCARAGATDAPQKGAILLRIGFFIPEFPLGLAMKTDALFERVLMRMRRELRAIRKEA